MARRRYFLLCSLAALGAVWLGSSAAAEQAQPPGSVTDGAASDEDLRVDYQLDVMFVEFDVSVHDRRGDFIPGLTREQFHLFEDGREVPITSFEELVQKFDALAPEAGPAKGRSFLVFVDTFLAGTQKVAQIRRDLVRFFQEHIAEGDTISLAVLGPRGALQISPGLSRAEATRLSAQIELPSGRFGTPSMNSYDQARHVLAQVEEAVSYVLASDTPSPRSLIFLSPGFIPAEPSEKLDMVDVADIVRTMAPAGVAPPPGRFNPMNPDDADSRRFRGRVAPIRGRTSVEDLPSIEVLLSSLAGWLSARNITLYSINCGDKGPLDLFSNDLFSAATSGDGSSGFSVGLSVAESLKLEMLQDLAELTGGLAWLNTRSYGRAFHKIDQATACIYRIGFRPDTDRPRGRYHKLKIVVDQRKVKVRHPRGYLDS